MADTINFTSLGLTGTGLVKQTAAKSFGVGTATTSDLPEGSNLYYTNARASAAAPVQSVAGRTGAVTLSNTDVSGLGTAATQNISAFLQTSNNLSDLLNIITSRFNLGVDYGYDNTTYVNLSANTTMSNPMVTETDVSFSIASGIINLPAMNATNSMGRSGNGRIFSINVIGSNNVTIANNSGTVLVSNVSPGTKVTFFLESNSTAAGAFRFFATPLNSTVPSSANTVSAGGLLTGGGALSSNPTISLSASNIVMQSIIDTSTARTLAVTDANSIISFTNAAGAAITIPLNANVPIPVGACFEIRSKGGGASVVSVALQGGVSLESSFMTTLPSIGYYGYIILKKLATDVWELSDYREEYLHATTFTWGTFTTASLNVYIKRIGSTVNVYFPRIVIPSTQNATVSAGTNLPARFIPSADSTAYGSVTVSGSLNSARYVASSGGSIIIQSANSGAFNGTSLTADPTTVSYSTV